MTPIAEVIQSWWGYDLMNRKPSAAYDEDGIFQGTDLDLACFLYALAGRGAVINLPDYKAHTKTKIREDQVLKSKRNRHGELLSVGGNKDFWSFNININDLNVIGEDRIGDARTFSITNKAGEWYDGWTTIQFEPTLKENRFITENALWSGNKIVFKHFIHPNRWTSVFGQHYVITRLFMDRLTDQAAHLNREVKRLLATGLEFPKGEGPRAYVPTSYGKSKQETFTAFEMKVYMPETQYSGEYPSVKATVKSLVEGFNTKKKYTYSILPKLRFMTRASEFAHSNAPDRMPAWIKNVEWEPGFKIPPRGRTEYDRLKLFQDKVGEHSISLLKRTYNKAATVSDE